MERIYQSVVTQPLTNANDTYRCSAVLTIALASSGGEDMTGQRRPGIHLRGSYGFEYMYETAVAR